MKEANLFKKTQQYVVRKNSKTAWRMCGQAPILSICVRTASLLGQKNVKYVVTTLSVLLTVHFEGQTVVKKRA